MTRIYPDYAYGPGPRAGCFWDSTCELPEMPALDHDLRCDVAIIGAGVTGLNAAMTLRVGGVDVCVLEAEQPGWGASGRNGGFCCLGGGKLSDAALDRQFGKAARLEWRQAEVAAVNHVAAFLDVQGEDADRQPGGETWVAHRRRHLRGLDAEMAAMEENYGVSPKRHDAADLVALGMSAGFHGGLTLPIGFGLNPRKYMAALLRHCRSAGVGIHGHSPVQSLLRRDGGWRLAVPGGSIQAREVIVATNGYCSETLPSWLAGRYMPAQSAVIVTRPLTPEELESQGWTSRQMVYDSRQLLHYFRLLPDNRMLFGMRGGLIAGPSAQDRSLRKAAGDFRRMFPAWQEVEVTHSWSGFVSLSRRLLPIVGPVPEAPGLWTAMCYHGNGVAMGSYAGTLVAQSVLAEDRRPAVLRTRAMPFPLGRARRALLWAAYLGYVVADL